MTIENKGFAARWSTKKTAARQEEKTENDTEIASLPEVQSDSDKRDDKTSAEKLTEADFEDVNFDELDKSSDYTRFVQANVPAAIQKRALRKLWASDSVFEVLDGMNDYDEDFTGNGLAGKIFKTAHKVGRGFVQDDEAEPDNVDIAEAADLEETPDGEEDADTEEIAEIRPEDTEDTPEKTG